MKSLSLCVPLLIALLAPAAVPAAGGPASRSQASAPILYDHAGALFRVNPVSGAIRKLTPQTGGVYRIEGSWSPTGKRIVYTRATDPAPGNPGVYLKAKLYRIDAQGGNALLLTRGPDRHQQPAWGPGPLIALVDATTNCLSVVRYDGRGLRPLFCPPFPHATEVTWSTPQWSPDGKSLLIQAGEFGTQGLDPPWELSIYRVQLATGVGRLLFKHEYIEPTWLTIAPDGKHGIYYEASNGTRMLVIDFVTGSSTAAGLGTGGAYYGIRYSPDGRRVAFSHDIVRPDPVLGYRGYNGTYVMRADGSDIRLITAEAQSSIDQTVQIYASVVGWSGDGSHLLLNRICDHLEHGRYVSYPSIRTVDVSTHAVKALPKVKGLAEDGAWFHPR